MIASLREVAGRSQQIAKVAPGIYIVRLKADRLAERRLRAHPIATRQLDNPEVTVGLGHIRIYGDGLLEGGDGIRRPALRLVCQPEFMPGGGVTGRDLGCA